MTREEAINWLNFIKYHVDNKIMATFDDGSKEALNMAIEALSTPSGDLISKQMAIDAVTGAIWHYPNECYKNLNVYEVAEELVSDAIKSPPSAETQTIFIEGIGHFPKLSETSQNPTEPNNTCEVDLISRADAMGAVQDHFNANGFKGYDDGQKMMDRIKELPSTYSVQGWIPCSERSPKHDEAVLITTNKEIEIGTVGFDDEWYVWNGGRWLSADNVTAWMPLPEPYREDGE